MRAQRGTVVPAPRWLLVGGLLGTLLVVLVALAATTASAGLWVAALLVGALDLGGAALLLATGPRPPGSPTRGPDDPGAPPGRGIDDLPGFYDNPPGSPPARTTTPAAAPESSPTTASPTTAPADRSTAGAVAGLGVASAGLILAAAVVALLSDGDGGAEHGGDAGATSTSADTEGGTDADAQAATTPAPSGAATTPSRAPLAVDAAGDLADTDLDPGEDGLAARLTFQGIVLEPRAAGATITYPRVALSSDGTGAVAHLELPTWNCFAAAAPPDPAAAGCTPTITEYADLPSPDLQLQRRADAVELSGSFATYTRPHGSPPTYTGRTYVITVGAGPDGAGRDGPSPAVGTLQLGGASTPTTEDPTASRIVFGGT